MIDKKDEKETALADSFNEHLVTYAIERGGTCTGEHGVGIGKKKYQRLEHGAAYDLMTTIKKSLDLNVF